MLTVAYRGVERGGGAGMNPNFTSRSEYLFPNRHRNTAGYCLLLVVSMTLAKMSDLKPTLKTK